MAVCGELTEKNEDAKYIPIDTFSCLPHTMLSEWVTGDRAAVGA